MTCLYCGKKLGFFSRYKDTPFCSEEHLRAHQDEMERALMERLGSKISAQSGQRELAREEAPPQELKAPKRKPRETSPQEEQPSHFAAPLDIPQPSARLSNASTRRGEVRNFPSTDASAQELAPIPAAERPIDKRSLLQDRETQAQAQAQAAERAAADRQTKKRDDEPREGDICEDFFESEHQAIAGLDITKPWLAPSTFAIIVQADFCTPSLPDVQLSLQPAPVEDEFSLEMDASAPEALDVAPPAPASEAGFLGAATELPRASGGIPTGMPTIASLAGEPAQDIWEAFPAEESLFELDFASAPTMAPPSAPEPANKRPAALALLGARQEVPMRPRHRYPYPGSDLQTNWTDRTSESSVRSFTAAEEWGGVEPAPYRNALEDRISAEKADIQPQLEVSLSLSALCAQVIREENETPFERDPQTQPVLLLPANAGLYADTVLGDWATSPSLPAAATPWQPNFRFPKSTPARPMSAVNFPSLFQLSPAMPPRPEGVLHG
jgi:hypothetical protein